MRDRDWIGIASTAWIIGFAALLCDHFQPSRPLVIGMRALFAVVTAAAICLVLIAKVRALAGAPQPELYLFTRLVSRWVYILMYVLALARLLLNPGPLHSLEDFQFYVGCCVVPLWLVRAVVLALPSRGRVLCVKRGNTAAYKAIEPAAPSGSVTEP